MAPIISGKNFYDNLFKNPLVKKMLPKNPSPAQLARLALVSTLTKDGLNCYYYTTQSLHNEKIPEDKRKFVAALDLSNGLMNIAVPLATAPLVEKYTDPLFEKLFGKYFDSKAGKEMVNTLKSGKAKGAELAEKVVTGRARKWGKSGFSVIIMLVFSQILCKRIITPTISTPMADYFKKQLEKMEKSGTPKDKTTETQPAKNETESTTKATADENNSQPSTKPDAFTAFNQLASKPVKFTVNA